MIHTIHNADFRTSWRPEDYLKQYYTTASLPADELAIYNFIIHYLQAEQPHFVKALDFGCGPTVHHIIPFIPYVEEVHLADYLPANLLALQQWLHGEPSAHNWDMYVQSVLTLEGIARPSSAELEIRKAQMRCKTRRIKQGNLFWKHPLKDGATYPLVLSFYCADSATHSKSQWRLFMRHLFNLIAPGGTLILSALHNTEHYNVGEQCFPSARVNENDMYAILSEGQFCKKTFDIHTIHISGWEEEGFDSIMLIKAQKTTSRPINMFPQTVFITPQAPESQVLPRSMRAWGEMRD
jgi:NNMT/PNMT/TEMT family